MNSTIVDREDQPIMEFMWGEHGGPPVAVPKRKSFGTTLLQHAISGQISAYIEYATGGLIYRLAVPLSAVAANYVDR